MKRAPGLLKLSREHHVALVLAQRLANVSDSASLTEMMNVVSATFSREIEPHFYAEESTLLPMLDRAGKTDLVNRTLEEHRRLRELAECIGIGDQTSLKPFGLLLKAHVRFEERDLFPAAETVLPALKEDIV